MSAAARPLTSPRVDDETARRSAAAADVLRRETAKMNALGIDGTVVLSTSNVDELMAYLDAVPPCAPST